MDGSTTTTDPVLAVIANILAPYIPYSEYECGMSHPTFVRRETDRDGRLTITLTSVHSEFQNRPSYATNAMHAVMFHPVVTLRFPKEAYSLPIIRH